MSIWKREVSIEVARQSMKNTLCDHLGMQITEIGDDYLTGTMPVDHRTHQPVGLLHGGASVALAETLGSMAANYVAEEGTYFVGQEINANHIRSAKFGIVTGTAKPVHIGRSSQVWEIKITNEQGKLVCISRLTMAGVNK